MDPKTSSSRLDSSKSSKDIEKERLKVLDRIYWLRTFLAAIAGIVSGIFYRGTPQPYTTAAVLLIFYAISIVSSVAVDRRGLAGRVKVYLHGIGIYILMWFMMMSLYLTLAYSLVR